MSMSMSILVQFCMCSKLLLCTKYASFHIHNSSFTKSESSYSQLETIEAVYIPNTYAHILIHKHHYFTKTLYAHYSAIKLHT